MQKSIIIILLSILLLSCKKDDSSPTKIIEPPVGQGKTTVLLEKGLINDRSPDWPIITMLTAKVSVSNIDTSVYFAMSESSPNDTIVILSHGVINKKLDTTGIPIADEFLYIKGYMRYKDSSSTVNLYEDLASYWFVDSITIEPYRLIGTSDTILVNSRVFLKWKSNYRIDTLKFNVYFKPNLEVNYDRFSTSSMNFLYKQASYDSLSRVAKFIVGIPTMNSEPNIILYPFSKIDRVYENSYLKIISRFDYQVQKKIVTWQL